MLTFPVIPAKAGIQAPLEADIASILGSSLRQNDETGLLNCLIIKCQHYLVLELPGTLDAPVPVERNFVTFQREIRSENLADAFVIDFVRQSYRSKAK